jgi:hypothetical protein
MRKLGYACEYQCGKTELRLKVKIKVKIKGDGPSQPRVSQRDWLSIMGQGHNHNEMGAPLLASFARSGIPRTSTLRDFELHQRLARGGLAHLWPAPSLTEAAPALLVLQKLGTTDLAPMFIRHIPDPAC